MESRIAELRQLEASQGDALFARGFLLADAEPAYVPSHWTQTDLPNGRRVYSDPRNTVSEGSRSGSSVWIVGDVYSVDTPTSNPTQIAQALANELATSRARYYEALDRLHGRWVVFSTRDADNTLHVTTDATGMRATYYAQDTQLVGSHAHLLAVNAGAEVVELGVNGYGAPANLTPYVGVFLLTPNQELCVETLKLTRYWPRRPLRRRSVRSAADRASDLMVASLEGIVARRGQVIASLTAGTDSRVTLAILMRARATAAARFFTYYWDNDRPTDVADREVSASLAATFGLDHRLIRLPDYSDISPAMTMVLDANTYRIHSRILACAYVGQFPGGGVHVRSNLSEIGRAFYLKKSPLGVPTSGKALAAIYRKSVRGDAAPTPEAWSRAESAFEDMYRETRFGEATQFVDGRDLMYWEHRMGAWHSHVVLESDIAFDSLSLYNSRAVLTELLSVTLRARFDDALLTEIISRSAPRLLDTPFNPGVPKPKTAPAPPPQEGRFPRVERAVSRVRKNRYVRGVKRRARKLLKRG